MTDLVIPLQALFIHLGLDTDINGLGQQFNVQAEHDVLGVVRVYAATARKDIGPLPPDNPIFALQINPIAFAGYLPFKGRLKDYIGLSAYPYTNKLIDPKVDLGLLPVQLKDIYIGDGSTCLPFNDFAKGSEVLNELGSIVKEVRKGNIPSFEGLRLRDEPIPV